MTSDSRYYGGLVLEDVPGDMLERSSRLAAATLEEYGNPVERIGNDDGGGARVTSTHYAVRLSLGPVARHKGHMRRLQVEMFAADPMRDDAGVSELLLVVMLCQMSQLGECTQVEWLTPGAWMTCEEFRAAFGRLSPEKIRKGDIGQLTDPRFQPVETTMQRLDRRIVSRPSPQVFAFGEADALYVVPPGAETADDGDAPAGDEDEMPNDVQRLSVWAMTGVVVFMSAPVAVSLAAVNLARGEDFRFSTHVLALTGFLVSIQSSGALAAAVAHLPI